MLAEHGSALRKVNSSSGSGVPPRLRQRILSKDGKLVEHR